MINILSLMLSCVFLASNIHAETLTFKIPETQIQNKHYQTQLTVTLGQRPTKYYLSGQQEPTQDNPSGIYYLIATPENASQPSHWINLEKIYSVKFEPGNLTSDDMSVLFVTLGNYIFGGTTYNVRYTPNSIFKPRVGFVYFEPAASSGLTPVKVSSLAILKALYNASSPLGQLPLRVAQYSKKNSPQENWIIVMNTINDDAIGDFKSDVTNAELLPISKVTPPAQFYRVNFEGYRLGLAYIDDAQGRSLFVRVDPE